MIVVCIKVGDKYDPVYVNRLASMVVRYSTDCPRFICLTDDERGLKCEWAPIETDLSGWWAKLVLFKPHSILDQRFIYIDLDTVIVDSIDFLYRYRGPFCILHDFWGPSYNSSVISMVPGFAPWVWRDFYPAITKSMHGDQDWITKQVHAADLWQNVAPRCIGSYKADCLQNSPDPYSLICFHGEPKPHQITEGWVPKAWR